MKCIKSSIYFLCLIAVSSAVIAQSSVETRAENNLKKFNFGRAAELYKKASSKAPNDVTLKEKLARTYVLMEDHINAEATYADIVKTPNIRAIDKLYYGLELRANGKYDEAAKAFNEYAQNASDIRSKELGVPADKMKALAVDNKIHTITTLSDQNSPVSDMGVAFYKDGGLIFSSNRGSDASVLHTDVWTNNRFYNLYTVRGDQNGNLFETKALKGKQPNRKFHEGSPVLSADGKEMYFTRSNYVKCKAQKSKDKIIKLKIFHADWDANKGKWVNILQLPFNNNEYSVGHPALSKDGKRLFFISDMPGGFGETDIYVSYRDNNSWGTPINLGRGVNTEGREMFPFISDDGVLYFSSDSRLGIGGLDVYAATFTNGEWSGAQNLGAPLNSSADDFGYIIDAKNENGYFVSNRTGGKGDDDIYKFKKNAISLCGTVVDARSKEMLPGSEVKLYEGTELLSTKPAGPKGDFCFSVLPGKNYKVTATKGEYEPNSVSLTTTRGNSVVQIPLSKLGGIDLTVCVTQAGKGTLEGSTVTLTNKATGDKKFCTITADCKCRFDLEPNIDYEICATKESTNENGSYDKPCRTVSTKGKVAPASIYETLEMTYLEKDMIIKIENLYYDLNKWNIRPDAAVELNKVLTLMQKFPAMEIELSSHTDCRASLKYNDELSAKRAKSCVDYLIANGIDGKRMIAAGYGERKLVNNCACEGKVKSTCTEQEHQQNRRTEFKILKIK